MSAELVPVLDDQGRDLKSLVEDYERRLIQAALSTACGQQNRAAALLGVLPTTLHEKIKRLGIPRGLTAGGAPGAQTVSLDGCEEFRWRGRVGPGSTLEIKGASGRIRAGANPGPEVEVLALKSGMGGVGQVAVSVLEHEGGVMFSVFQSRGSAGEVGRPTVGAGRLKVDFEVRVPPGVAFVARLYSGNIEVWGLQGAVDAQTLSGTVRIGSATTSPAPV